jgi:MFS transporter, PHS family, inorganic phosphate transporter
LFVIGNVMMIMKYIYPVNSFYTAFISTAAILGAVIGQLFFGILCDRMGRRAVSIITIVLVVLGSILSAFCIDSSFLSVYVWLGLTRFILGVGVGGEYPVSLI